MNTPPDSPSTVPLPLAAPCRALEAGAALRWLRLGWADLCRAPRQSLVYGAAMVVVSYVIAAGAWAFGNLGLYLGLLSGFVFLGPLLALNLYAISDQLERSRPLSLHASLRRARAQLGNAMVFALVLMIIFLVWARAATMVHVFFPVDASVVWRDLAMFLGVGSVVGAIFCVVVFTASAFSLPMILDRRVDMITAVISSANAVLRNKAAMLVWALIIVACVLAGFATAFLGLAVLLPLLGYATWHAYRDTIDASAWPAADE
jgi:uncharacterized membrane protein